MQEQNSLEGQAAASDQFDEETGFITEEFEINAVKQQLQSVVDQADWFLETKNSKGWCLVEKFVKNMTDQLTKQLIIETDFDKIRRIQAEILAFQSIFSIIDQALLDANDAKKELGKFEGEF